MKRHRWIVLILVVCGLLQQNLMAIQELEAHPVQPPTHMRLVAHHPGTVSESDSPRNNQLAAEIRRLGRLMLITSLAPGAERIAQRLVLPHRRRAIDDRPTDRQPAPIDWGLVGPRRARADG